MCGKFGAFLALSVIFASTAATAQELPEGADRVYLELKRAPGDGDRILENRRPVLSEAIPREETFGLVIEKVPPGDPSEADHAFRILRDGAEPYVVLTRQLEAQGRPGDRYPMIHYHVLSAGMETGPQNRFPGLEAEPQFVTFSKAESFAGPSRGLLHVGNASFFYRYVPEACERALRSYSRK